MKARHLFAIAALAACAAAGQEPALPSGRTPDAADASLSHPPVTESELLRQIEAIEGAGPVTTIPKVAPAKKGGTPGASENGNGTTEITANEGAFDSRNHVAVFLRDAQDQVFVENPDFTVKCNKLTAYLRHNDKDDATPGAAAKPKPKPAAAPTPAGKVKLSNATSGNATLADRNAVTQTGGTAAASGDKSTGGLEKAVCEGEVVITQDKIDPDGTLTHNTGHSRMAVYDADTGDITLTGLPEVEQGINSCVALSETTRIILNRNGKMRVFGPHKNTIRDSGSTPGATTSNSPASSSPAVANAR